MDIAPSAHKHGISDQRIREALRTTVTEVPVDRGMWMHLGHDANGIALEIGVVDSTVVVHAMRMRPVYRAEYERFR